jgi:hypothetical protein
MVFPKSLPIKQNDSSINLSIVSIIFFALPLTKNPHFLAQLWLNADILPHPLKLYQTT